MKTYKFNFEQRKFLREGLRELLAECHIPKCPECKEIRKLIKRLRG
jgi:hypothetical protein